MSLQPSGGGASVAMISPHHCSPHPVDLTFVRKVKAIPDGDLVVKDNNGKIVFKVKDILPNNFAPPRKILLDRSGNPVLTLQKKAITAHNRWQVFRGDSTEYKDLVFSAKSHSVLYLKGKLDVFLAHNRREKECDFKVRGSYAERSSVVYSGDEESSAPIAQMHNRRHVAPNLLLGREDSTLNISANVDYAFMVAVIVILDEIDNEGRDYATGISHASLPILLST